MLEEIKALREWGKEQQTQLLLSKGLPDMREQEDVWFESSGTYPVTLKFVWLCVSIEASTVEEVKRMVQEAFAEESFLVRVFDPARKYNTWIGLSSLHRAN